MSWEVHIEWQGETRLVGRLHSSQRSPAVSFEYASGWLDDFSAFAIDPTSLPLGPGPLHSPGLFGALLDCGPDRWGRLLIERAVRRQVLPRKPYRDVDYVMALDDSSRLGALRFRIDSTGPFLAPTQGKLPPLIRLQALLRAADAVHAEKDTADGPSRPSLCQMAGSPWRSSPSLMTDAILPPGKSWRLRSRQMPASGWSSINWFVSVGTRWP